MLKESEGIEKKLNSINFKVRKEKANSCPYKGKK